MEACVKCGKEIPSGLNTAGCADCVAVDAAFEEMGFLVGHMGGNCTAYRYISEGRPEIEILVTGEPGSTPASLDSPVYVTIGASIDKGEPTEVYFKFASARAFLASFAKEGE